MDTTSRGLPSGKPGQARNLANIKKAQLNGSRQDGFLASLRETQIVASRPVLPAELIATILDYLPVPELLRFARVSRRLQEMVYDDTRWIQRLKNMGVWDEGEARQRFEDSMRRKAEAQKARETEEARRTGANLPGSINGIAGGGRVHAGSVTLFDAGLEEEKYRKSLDKPPDRKRRGTLADGFDDMTISPSSPIPANRSPWDPSKALDVLSKVRSVRGQARQEFGKVYDALAPLYLDLARSKGHSDPIVFRSYRDPEQQAQVLSQLKRFARCDNTQGWQQREEKLESMIAVFENAVLREFEQGYEAQDTNGRMERYAHVLVTLNGGAACIDVFIQNHPVMLRRERLGNPLECLHDVAPGHVDLGASQRSFESLASTMVELAATIDTVFPPSVDVLLPFLTRVGEDVIAEYLTALFDEAHVKGVETYVKAVSGTFEQAMRFAVSVKPTKASKPDFAAEVKRIITHCYEPHVDLYLTEELDLFKTRSEAEVSLWERQLSEQEASTESFFMSNINRQAAKRDFLSSFKKVVMMPVNVLPAFPLSSPFASSKPAATIATRSSAGGEVLDLPTDGSRPSTPALSSDGTPKRSSTPLPAPTTELAAKAAIMNSRLEGIKSLFSIEVALNLIHYAKSSLERAALLVQMGGQSGDEAKEQCETIFVTLLGILGQRHIKNGFDKAVDHLGTYNPREVKQFRSQTTNTDGTTTAEGSKAVGVESLVTFLELVNVGDLIQQMVDVFYAQELVATRLTDRDDFLSPAVKEKKRFEQVLDERVAAGLNKGIDVLMDEVEFICATTQVSTDFNPGADKDDKGGVHALMDIGPSTTARQVVDTVAGHTGMLVGSTDKNMLDVFNQEVGVRLFGVLCKHFKRQRISVDGAIKFISDINHYSAFISTLRQKPLIPYFTALRELAQIFLVEVQPPASYFPAGIGSRASTQASNISARQARELAAIIADTERYRGIFGAEEVYEFAERRADWYAVKRDVEKAMYGIGCVAM